MKPALLLLASSALLFITRRCEAQNLPPLATGEILTSAFQIPIQTLNAVHGLLQAARGRINAVQERYTIQQQNHPNHHLNPTFSLPDRKTFQAHANKFQFNSKALFQPWRSAQTPKRRSL